MVRLVARFVSDGFTGRWLATALVALTLLPDRATLRAQEPAADASRKATEAASLGAGDLPPPTREEAETARTAFLESDYELKKLVGELTAIQTSYLKKGADQPALEAAFETAKTAAQTASQRLEGAALTIARAGIPKRGEVDNIDVAMPTYQSARKVCSAMVAAAINTDSPEQALVLVDQLERVGAIDGDVLMMGATAAMILSRLDEADAYLDKLSAVGGSADKQARVEELKEVIDDDRKKVKDEMALRAAEAEADDLPRVKIKTSAGDLIIELFENEGLEPQQRILGNFMGLYRTELQFMLASRFPRRSRHRAVRERGSQHRRQLHQPRREGLLRGDAVPSRHPRVHGPGGRSDRPRLGGTGLRDSVRDRPAERPPAFPRLALDGPRRQGHRRLAVLPHVSPHATPRRQAHRLRPGDRRV